MNDELTTKFKKSKRLENPDYVTTASYRGVDTDVFMDDAGQQYYIVIDGKEMGLGTFNPNYEQEIADIIDYKLDTIAVNWSDSHFGKRLEWFVNGTNRDIKLSYKNRIIHIFLTDDDTPEANIDVEELKRISDDILDFLDNSKNNNN